MAKKTAKSSKDKAKKKPVKKAAPKKVAKPAKKVAAKKPAKPAPKKAAPPAKKASAPVKAAKPGKEPVLKFIVNTVKKALTEKPAKAEKAAKPAKAAKPVKPLKAPKIEAKAKVQEPEIPELELDGEDEIEENEEVVLTDAEGRRYCRVKDCDQLSAVDGYCRYHYLALWKRIQVRKKILSEGKLERYVEELTARYPDKFLDMLRKDLRSEKEFLAAIQELEIDESAVDNEFEDEAQNYIDEVRGVEPTTRDEEDF